MKKFIQLGYDAGTGFHHVNGVSSVKPQQESLVFGSGMYEYAPAGTIEIEVDDNTGQLIPPVQDICSESQRQRSSAWGAVTEELHKHDPDFMLRRGTGVECALMAIALMAEKAKKYDAIAQMLGS